MFLAIFLACITVAVFIHESGHYIAAVRRGRKVTRVTFGSGPRLYRRACKNSTVIEVRLLLLSGEVVHEGDEKYPDPVIGIAGSYVQAWVAFVYLSVVYASLGELVYATGMGLLSLAMIVLRRWLAVPFFWASWPLFAGSTLLCALTKSTLMLYFGWFSVMAACFQIVPQTLVAGHDGANTLMRMKHRRNTTV